MTYERHMYWFCFETAVRKGTVMQETAAEWITWTQPAYFGWVYSGFGIWIWLHVQDFGKFEKGVGIKRKPLGKMFDYNYKLRKESKCALSSDGS